MLVSAIKIRDELEERARHFKGRTAAVLLEAVEWIDSEIAEDVERVRLVGDVDQWLLLTEPGESGAIETINAVLRKKVPSKPQFLMLDERSWGGGFHPMKEAYGIVVEPVEPSIIFDAVRAAEWMEPDMCAVVFAPDDEEWQFYQVDQLCGDAKS